VNSRGTSEEGPLPWERLAACRLYFVQNCIAGELCSHEGGTPKGGEQSSPFFILLFIIKDKKIRDEINPVFIWSKKDL
jgi:hypothetical protein